MEKVVIRLKFDLMRLAEKMVMHFSVHEISEFLHHKSHRTHRTKLLLQKLYSNIQIETP